MHDHKLHRSIVWITAVVMAVVLGGCNATRHGATEGETWREAVDARLKSFGHRNVIAIVDSAYPAQSKPGVEMITTGQEQIEVVKAVLEEVARQTHVRARIMTDAELAHVAEADAPGITEYRRQLGGLLAQAPATTMAHEKIIASLDETSQTFKVLLLKTNLSLPYTSVFVWLECGYWSDEAEKRLRESMKR